MAKGDEKTEEPTGRRLREARREGQVPQSQELPQALTLAAGALLLPAFVHRFQVTIGEGWRQSLGSVGVVDPGAALSDLGRMAVRCLLLLVPLLATVIAGAFLSRAFMGGVRLNFFLLKPKPKKLNPIKGVKNLFSRQQLGNFVRLALKVVALGVATYALWATLLANVLRGPASLETSVAGVAEGVRLLFIVVLAISAVATGIDVALAVRRHRKSLRMTKQEVRDDQKQTETNPLVKGEMRARQRKMSRLRMMAEVSRADVVLTNPTHLAVALRYDEGFLAPVVVGKGAGYVAQRIREVAAASGVPIKEDKPLARALYGSVEIGDVIPVELYQTVAEILALVYRAGGGRPRPTTATPAGGLAGRTVRVAATLDASAQRRRDLEVESEVAVEAEVER